MLIETFALLLLAGTADQGTETARGAGDDNRIVCRARQGMTGSRVARQRVCRTTAEWRRHDAELQENRRDMETRRTTQPSPRL